MSNRAKDIFAELLDLPDELREGRLTQLCENDFSLKQEVQSLLDAHRQAGEFLDQPTMDSSPLVSSEVQVTEQVGTIIDRYKLLEKIGEGGFGIVYMAQQSEPIRRRVALKIIKLGMDTKQVVARFEAERQALAMMDHPNIARVIDGGSTDTGRPFFVMELVRGDPITAFCDQKKLPLQERLELFKQVCRAVEHAHQKGIIHRDIKPSNVLVTIADDKPLVKVIDFGIAKATSAELTEKTLFTEFRQLVGTPLYMSPEQAERSGVDVDTRTDIYSLGVLLYEILTGRTPLDPKRLNSAAWGELQRMIVDDEPSRPSVMVSSAVGEMLEVAKSRGTEPSRLGSMLKGDLDWIVLKSIEKDRSRRYATASQLADDIDSFLNDAPVTATPPSRIYQWKKFAKRNSGLLAAAACILLALLAGLVATAWSASWAMQERDAAQRAYEQAVRNEANAKRAAVIAGAGKLLPDDETIQLADDWQEEIDRLKSELGESDPKAVRSEAEFTTWYATWLNGKDRDQEAKLLIDQCFERVREVVGDDDPVFLALCERKVLVDGAAGVSIQEIAAVYDQLVVSMAKVHGEKAACLQSLEHAVILSGARRDDDARKAIERYISHHENSDDSITFSESDLLSRTIDGLLTRGGRFESEVQKLQRIRGGGKGSETGASAKNDPELARDWKALQGSWESKLLRENGELERMIVEFRDSEVTTKFLNSKGDVIRSRLSDFELKRNGAAKVFWAYSAGTKIGGAFIYKIEDDVFYHASGLLENVPSLPETELRKFRRIESAP